MLSFKNFISKNMINENLNNHIKSFKKYGKSDECKDEWGDNLHTLASEPGNCSMVSNSFIDHLKKHNMDSKAIVGFHPTNKKWSDMGSDDGTDAHTAVLVGDHVIDWTARQFNKHAKFPKISHIDDFKNEWEKTKLH